MQLITDLMDLAGSLLIVAALAVLVAPWGGIAAALAVAGVGVLITSWLIDEPQFLQRRRKGKKKGGDR